MKNQVHSLGLWVKPQLHRKRLRHVNTKAPFFTSIAHVGRWSATIAHTWSACEGLEEHRVVMKTRGVRIMLEKVAVSARKAVKLAEPYKPYGGQFLEFCSISLSTYQICMKLTGKSTEFCQFFCRHYPHMPNEDRLNGELQMVPSNQVNLHVNALHQRHQ